MDSHSFPLPIFRCRWMNICGILFYRMQYAHLFRRYDFVCVSVFNGKTSVLSLLCVCGLFWFTSVWPISETRRRLTHLISSVGGAVRFRPESGGAKSFVTDDVHSLAAHQINGRQRQKSFFLIKWNGRWLRRKGEQSFRAFHTRARALPVNNS